VFAWLVAGWSAVVIARLAWRAALAGRGHRDEASALADHGHADGASRATALARRGARVAVPCVAAGAVALAAATAARHDKPDEHVFEFAALARLEAGLRAIPAHDTVLLNARLDSVVTPLRPELTFALRRMGVRALGTGAYLRLGYWYERAGHSYDHVLWLFDRGAPRMPGGRVLARARLRVEGREHTVGLLLAPAPVATRAHRGSGGGRPRGSRRAPTGRHSAARAA
jgi:hypothetical protein